MRTRTAKPRSPATPRQARSRTPLHETEQRLALAVHAANVGLWDWDLQTNKVYFSAEWKSQLGYAPGDIADDFSEWEQRVHPADLMSAKARVNAYLENPQINFQNEFRMRHKDGSYRWILAHASFLNDEQGRPIRMLGSHIDITERKRSENQIVQMKRLYATLSQVNQTIVRVKGRTELYQSICDVAVTFGEFSAA